MCFTLVVHPVPKCIKWKPEGGAGNGPPHMAGMETSLLPALKGHWVCPEWSACPVQVRFLGTLQQDQCHCSGSDRLPCPQEKGGNLFDKIGNWFNDRKDEASNAAGSAKNRVQDAGKKGKK